MLDEAIAVATGTQIVAQRQRQRNALLGVVIEMADNLGEPIPASRAVYALARAINPKG